MASSSQQHNMMRIAIAGSGGLAQIFAHSLNETSHQFMILSRTPRPRLEALGYQVVVVDYNNQTDLQFYLRGVDLVVSTISGNPQINLIDAAAVASVRRFIPAEWEGAPGHRPRNDPLDRGRAACLDRLRHWSRQRRPMRSTIFSCGVFYERFAREGLAALGIGSSTGVSDQGSYLMDVGACTAEVVERTQSGQPVTISMISLHDVGRFLVAAIALDLQAWRGEFRMQGDRRTVTEILQWAEFVRGATFSTDIIAPVYLATRLQHASYYQDLPRIQRIQELIATEQRRYDFTNPNLNGLVDITPISFWDWLRTHWGS